MNKIRKGILSLMVMLTLIIVSANPSTIKAESISLNSYQKELDAINKKLGTNYAFPTKAILGDLGESTADILDYYRNMSIKEFHQYILDIYINDISQRKNLKIKNRMEPNFQNTVFDEIKPMAFAKTQKYYYSASNNNYLSIASTIYYADGADRYASINSYGYGHGQSSYPYYYPKDISKTYGTGNKTVKCTFKCTKYLSKQLIDAAIHKVSVTFNASGGDVHTYVEM